MIYADGLSLDFLQCYSNNALMATPRIPDDLPSSGEEVVALSYWRGHMDARMEDLSRRVESIEVKVDQIHQAVQGIVSTLSAKEATDQQARGLIRWALPDGAAAVAVVIALIAIAMRFVP
jgi:hypothetical protein